MTTLNNRNAFLNRFILIGVIERIKIKKNGTRIIHLRVSNRPDKILPGISSAPGFFTSVLLLRIQAAAINHADVSIATLVAGAEIYIEGNIQGICHQIGGEDYLTTELWAHRARLVRPAPATLESEIADQEDALLDEAQDDETMSTPVGQNDEGDQDTGPLGDPATEEA